MVVTNSTEIPPDSELTVQEINVDWPTLHAASFYLGKRCEWDSNEFMLCKKETKDARQCINEGKKVTACALQFFQELKKHCREQFEDYRYCLQARNWEMKFSECRDVQAALDGCVLKNMKIERPDYGYFCEVRVHDSPRPEPPKEPYPQFPGSADKLPDDAPRPKAKFGGRHVYQF